MSITEQHPVRRWVCEHDGEFWSVRFDPYFDEFLLYSSRFNTLRICEDVSARTMFMGLETNRDLFVNTADYYASVHWYEAFNKLEVVVRIDGEWSHLTAFREETDINTSSSAVS